jgi:hypothetical protein
VGKKKRILFAVLVLAVLGFLAWEVFRGREPVYQGKTLSEWLRSYDYQGIDASGGKRAERNDQVDEAVRHIGTNALPHLAKKLIAKDSSLKKKLVDLVTRQSLIEFHFTQAADVRERAYLGLRALGKEARPLIPMLVDSLRDQADADLWWLTAQALAGIGAEGMEPLTNAIAGTNAALRCAVAHALCRYREIASGPWRLAPLSAAELTRADACVIPALLRLLQDPDPEVRYYAVFSLGQIHRQPETVIPALVGFLNPREKYRSVAVYALAEFGEQARPALPAIVAALSDSDRYTRNAANNVLGKIDPETAAKLGIK